MEEGRQHLNNSSEEADNKRFPELFDEEVSDAFRKPTDQII